MEYGPASSTVKTEIHRYHLIMCTVMSERERDNQGISNSVKALLNTK